MKRLAVACLAVMVLTAWKPDERSACASSDIVGRWRIVPFDRDYRCAVTIDREGAISKSACFRNGRRIGRLGGRLFLKRCQVRGNMIFHLDGRAQATTIFGFMSSDKRAFVAWAHNGQTADPFDAYRRR